MSAMLELKQRFNLQEGDGITFVKDIWDKYRKEHEHCDGYAYMTRCDMDNYVIVERLNGIMGIYTVKGDVIIPEDCHRCWPEFYEDYDYHHEVICTRKDKLISIYSHDGKKQILETKSVKKISLTYYGIEIWKKSGGYETYLYTGKLISTQQIYTTEEVSYNDHRAIIFNHCGVYTLKGKEIIPFGNYTTIYNSPFFLVEKTDTKELYTFDGKKLPLDEATLFQWIDNTKCPIFQNGIQYINRFILAFKDDKKSALYNYAGKKVVPDVYKYEKMYLEKEYIICIGTDLVSMNIYDFEGNKISEFKP